MGFLNSLFGCALTKYDAQKYFDYAEKQKAKGNIVEALNYYAKVINRGGLGIKSHLCLFLLFVEKGWQRDFQSHCQPTNTACFVSPCPTTLGRHFCLCREGASRA